MKSPFTLMLAGLLLSFSAFAMSLQEAKSQGFLGEQQNGYLGQVKANAQARALMEEINAKRRAEYERIARKNNISVEDVARLAASKAFRAADRGEYVQDASGSWVKK
jgi:uncharacterized protein